MDIAFEYRQLLWRLVRDGSLDKDPERLMRMRDFLTCWDEWSAASQRQLAALRWGEKYLWFGLIPSFCVFLWAMTVMEREVQKKYSWFNIAEMALRKHRSESGYSVEEQAAIGALLEYVERVRRK